MKFKFLEHTADVKFQAFGKTLEEAFSNSALAMFNSMYNKKIKPKVVKKITAKGKDNEALLYNFLEELLILLDSEGFFLNSVKKIKIFGKTLKAEVVGDSAADYPLSVDVKAITYNEMFVKQEKGKWVCQVVLDV